MAHDFNISLEYEQSKFQVQDEFYIKELGATCLQRAAFETEDGKKLQKQDVDIQFTVGGKRINVSEKNRKCDYGDLLLEIYSKYPNTLGWMNNSNADFLAYFVPGKVYWINKRELEDFYNKFLANQIPDSVFGDMVNNSPRRSCRKECKIKINGNIWKVVLTQAYNRLESSDVEWYTESICVSFAVLREGGVTIKEYKI